MDRLQGGCTMAGRYRTADPVHRRGDHGVPTGLEPDLDHLEPAAGPDLWVLGTQPSAPGRSVGSREAGGQVPGRGRPGRRPGCPGAGRQHCRRRGREQPTRRRPRRPGDSPGNGVGLVLALGDLQYECGERANFTDAYDTAWGRSSTSPVPPATTITSPAAPHHIPVARRHSSGSSRSSPTT